MCVWPYPKAKRDRFDSLVKTGRRAGGLMVDPTSKERVRSSLGRSDRSEPDLRSQETGRVGQSHLEQLSPDGERGIIVESLEDGNCGTITHSERVMVGAF
ncbi:unnamed protein product [Gadus morhua 'NCC']